MTAPDRWRKPSRCGDGACVEVRPCTDGVDFRVSHLPMWVIHISAEEWAAFRDAIKAGEFDE